MTAASPNATPEDRLQAAKIFRKLPTKPVLAMQLAQLSI
jgi:hypothetical protein